MDQLELRQEAGLPGIGEGPLDGYFDQRFRLTITHTRSEFLKAVVQLDLVEDTWGQQRNFRINNSTDGELVRKAYIDFTLPKIGTLPVGKQPALLGYGLAFSDSSGSLDGLKWSNKWGTVGVSAMYFKIDDKSCRRGRSESTTATATSGSGPHDHPERQPHHRTLRRLRRLRRGHAATYNCMTTGRDTGETSTTIGLVGLAYTGEFADMITVKAEFSWIFGQADLRLGDQ